MRKKINITDTTLRDAQRALFDCRLTIDDILPIADKLDKVGFYSLDVWGCGMFEACVNDLKEDPWKRLEKLNNICKNTPLQGLLKGQYILLGQRKYKDNELEAFVEKSIERGVKILRIFHSLNDIDSLERTIKLVRKYHGHPQGNIFYSPLAVYSTKWYVDCVRRQMDMGILSLNISDINGSLTPQIAYELIKALKEEFKDLPIQLHCHCQGGMAIATYLKAGEAGIDIIDCAISPLSCGYSLPPAETIVCIFKSAGAEVDIDIELVKEISDYLEDLLIKKGFKWKEQTYIDNCVITYGLPKSVFLNLKNELRKQNAKVKLKDVLKEVERVCRDLGYPPIFDFVAEIITKQAVSNILCGRYRRISKELALYVLGYWGKAPFEISKELKEKVANQYSQQLTKDFEYPTISLQKMVLFPQEVGIQNQVSILEGEKLDEIEDLIEQIVNLSDENDLIEVEIKEGARKIYLKKEGKIELSQTGELPRIQESTIIEENSSLEYYQVKAPFSGILAKYFVKAGSEVKKGMTLCLIESMKLLNEIKSEVDGEVVDVLKKSQEFVKEGDVLFLIKSK